jgi:hypothetical protein
MLDGERCGDVNFDTSPMSPMTKAFEQLVGRPYDVKRCEGKKKKEKEKKEKKQNSGGSTRTTSASFLAG